MKQTGISAQAAIAGPEALAQAGGPPVLIAATILGKIHEMAVAQERAAATPALLVQSVQRGRAALNPEHPLMGPHPTD